MATSRFEISRRSFLGTTALLPFALHSSAVTPSKPRIVVIGAGAFGGWTALHLLKRGAAVTLLDAWGPGNSRSSSGGETRVIRAIYGPDRIYSEMVKRSFESWEQLDATVEESLYSETGVLWMHRGDDAYVRSSVPILHDLGFPLDPLSLDDAARRYPQISFRGIRSVWMERRGGALSARRSCVAIRDAVQRAGGSYRTARVQPGEIANGRMSSVFLDDGSRIQADAYVFACGPWLGRIFPDVIGDRIHPTRQEVFFFGTPAGSERYRGGNMPIWIDFGERIFYGLPDLEGRGFKISDDTRGASIDPNSENRTPSADAIARARQLLGERFPELAGAPLLEARICQYENSPDGHLILDRHPAASNVLLAGGGSGHGFKLSPAVGEMLAENMFSSKALPSMFALSRLHGEETRTQFETKKER